MQRRVIHPTHRPSQVRPSLEPLESRTLLHGGATDFHVQFAPAKAVPAEGYVIDAGAMFGARNDHGDLSYGWTKSRDAKAKVRRDTPLSPDSRYDGFAQVKRDATWELTVPNGIYSVHLVAGDSKAKRGAFGFDVEGTAALRGEITSEQRWIESTTLVTVSDGLLTVTSASGFKKNKISFIDVTPAVDAPAPEPTPAPTPPVNEARLSAWVAGAPSPIARAEAVGAAVGNKLYVFGGIDGPGSNYAYPVTARVDAYEPATNTWTRLADMPEPFTHTTGTVDGTTLWFTGGFLGDTPGPGSAHVWKYDTLTDTWAAGPDLPEARGGGASAIVGRTLHYFGGANRTRTADSPAHWSLNLDDPSATWVTEADMPVPRNHMAGVTVGDKIYAVGGQRGEGDAAVDLAEVDVYDPATGAWTRVAPMPTARSHTNCSTLVYEGKLLVLGGESANEMYHADILAYDPATNTWSPFAPLPDARSTAIAGIINNQLVFSTGNAPGISDNTWRATLP